MVMNQSLSDRESLEQFREKHPELQSLQQILALSEDQFVENYIADFEFDYNLTRRVYQTAVNLQAKTALIWANIKDIASPYLNQTLFNNIPQSFIDHQENIPGYDKFFHNLDYVDSSHCRSILSPAAYFVDLMRFIETYITNPNFIPQDCLLEHRRPDLYNLRLDCDNTYTLIPYIDLVNEILESIIRTIDEPDAYQKLADVNFPINLPFNLPLSEIRLYLEQFKTSLSAIYQAFDASPTENHKHIQREYLGLSPQEFHPLATPISTPEALEPYYYGTTDLENNIDDLADVAVFLEQTGLTRQELNTLIYQDLDRHEFNAGLSRLFFINNVDDGLGPLDIVEGATDTDTFYEISTESIINLSPAKLDHIYRFIKLSRKLEWSFAELDWVLRSLQPSFTQEKFLKFDGLNDFVAVKNPTNLHLENFTLEAWVNPVLSERNVVLSGKNLRANQSEINYFVLWIDATNKLAFDYSVFANDDSEQVEVITLEICGLNELPDYEFSHIAVTVDQATINLYLNGKLENTAQIVDLEKRQTQDNPKLNSDREFNLGRDLNNECFEGIIKEVRIWNVVRTQSLIANHRYQRFTGTENHLIGYWTLTENRLNTLTDLTSNENHGILGGDEFITQPKWVNHDLILDPLASLIANNPGYEFNGVDQYLGKRDIQGLPTPNLTLEVWVNLSQQKENPIFSLGEDFHFGIDGNNRLNLLYRGSTYTGSVAISPGQLIHIALSIAGTHATFYVDGTVELTATLSQDLVLDGTELEIGRDLGNQYFAGQLKEIRLWNTVRSRDQIHQYLDRSVPVRTPGLIGYWRLNTIENGLATDLSYNQNHLVLGGILEDYQPQRVTIDPLLPTPPIAIAEEVFNFDGENDVILIRHPQNWGLAKSEKFTLEFWFNPTATPVVNHQQILYSQGDAEAGLNLYLENNRLFAAAWCNNYEHTHLQGTILSTDTLTWDEWHHVAVVHDGNTLTAYLDGIKFSSQESFEQGNQYHLSPVGIASLGGMGQGGITRFQDSYSNSVNPHIYHFRGQMTEFRLWDIVKTQSQINQDRYTVPSGSPDLVAYFPLRDGEGETFPDQSGTGNQAQLQSRNVSWVTNGTDTELQNTYSHYQGTGVLDWTNYIYTGRLYIRDPEAGIGLTFFSRDPEDQAKFYRLQRHSQHPTFEVISHIHGVQELSGITDSGINPEVNTWYHFWIEVEDTGTQTQIKAKIWQDRTPEPQDFQISAYDDREDRLTAGTVGVWTFGTGEKYFDDLNVTTANQVLLKETFEGYGENLDPTNWKDTGDRVYFDSEIDLFQTTELDGETVFASSAEEHSRSYSHYNACGVLDWKNYEYSGRLYFTENNSGIGVTFRSRYPENLDQYYGIKRHLGRHRFFLDSHPQGIQSLKGITDSGVTPEANTWYRFRIAVEDSASQTQIKAKIWQQGTEEPTAWQIDAYDDSDIRLTAGTVGVYGSDQGSKYFDDLQVVEGVWLDQNFQTYSPNQHPRDWKDTKLCGKEAGEVFKTFVIDGSITLGTDGTVPNLSSRQHSLASFADAVSDFHSHYQPGSDWKNYIYTGKMYTTDADNGIGVTFLSQYPDLDQYYILHKSGKPCWKWQEKTFKLASHRHIFQPLQGVTDSKISPQPNTWYCFKIDVQDTGKRTHIKAKIWQEGEKEPTAWQIDAYDQSDCRLTQGTIGLWTRGKGGKYFDQLKVVDQILLEESFENSTNWKDTPARNPYQEDTNLYKTRNLNDNQADWQSISTYPLLTNPLNRHALQFDGERQYLATAVTAVDLNQLTLEAWVNPVRNQDHQILNTEPFSVGLDVSGKLTLRTSQEQVLGTSSIPNNTYTHVAITVEGTNVTFWINGNPDRTVILDSPLPLSFTTLELGKYFGGQLKEIRLWNQVLTASEIQAGQYQKPDTTNTELVGYWPLPENQGMTTADLSQNSNNFRLGGLETSRQPQLFDPLDQGFWRSSRKTLGFSSAEDILTWQSSDPSQGILQRRAIEVWFQVSDQTISSRKQVIYHQGDDQQGLTIYVYQGSLYFGGYNILSGDSQWQGTWLKTDRIASNRWHHAVLVLDGRTEVRERALQVYLDGKLADVGDGSQLGNAENAFTLGGVSNKIRFHDGVPTTGEDHDLEGQILDVKVWNTIRTPNEVANYRTLEVSDFQNPSQSQQDWWQKAQPYLRVWLQLETVPEVQIPGLVEKIYIPEVTHSQRWQTLGISTLPQLSPTRLDETILAELSQVKSLQETHNLSLEKLTALWYQIKHTGKEDQQTLFDEIFNPTDANLTPWNYQIDPAILWDINGNSNQQTDREIRSRLMAALQVSDRDLNLIVSTLSRSETLIAIDTAYLTQMYRLARIPKLLGLSIPEFTRLLVLIGIPTVNSIEDLVSLSDRAAWMRRTAINVYELDFLVNDVSSDRIPSYTETDVRNLADLLNRQSQDFLVTEESFVTDDISQFQSQQIFTFLTQEGLIDPFRTVTNKYVAPTTVEHLKSLAVTFADLAIEQDWKADFQSLGNDIESRLITDKFIDQNGYVIKLNLEDQDFSDASLKVSFPNATPETLSSIREALERRKAVQDKIGNTLVQFRDALTDAILSGLSTLLGATPELTQIIINYFASEMSPSRFWELILKIAQDLTDVNPIPAEITDYLYRLSKILGLVGQFTLTTTETTTFLNHPECFSVTDVFRPSLTDIDHLYTFQELRDQFNDAEGKLLGILQLNSQDTLTIIAAISDFTNWEKSQVSSLIDYFNTIDSVPFVYNRVAGLKRLNNCFEIAQLMGSDIDLIIQLANPNNLTFEFYSKQSASLFNVLRSNYTDQEWKNVYPPLRDRLSTAKQNALLGRAMLEIGKDYQGRKTPDILSEYLLIDVQTGSEVNTSRIVQANASLQLYVQRCLMNLEKNVNPQTIPTQQWEWIKNYRIWEANRKVFLYPENYIEPELRDTKTPLFADLEQQLTQADIDQASVEKAYTQYLDQFAQVANLKIAGSYLHKEVDNQGNQIGDEILYLIGRSDTKPRIYYYREYINQTTGLPWKKIDLPINSDFVTPICAFGKLFLFWSEFSKVVKSIDRQVPLDSDNLPIVREGGATQQERDDVENKRKFVDEKGYLFVAEGFGERVKENIDVYKPIVKYSFYNFSKNWIAPQNYLELNNELREDVYIRPEWQRVYAQRSLEFDAGDITQPADETQENVNVLRVSKKTVFSTAIPNFEMSQLTWSFWAKFEKEIGELTGEVTEAELSNSKKSISLFNYGNGVQATVTNNWSRIPGAPDLLAFEQAVTTAEGNVTTAQNRVNTAEENVTTAEGNVTTAQNRVNTAEDNVTTAQNRVDTAEENVTTAQNRVDTAQTNLDNATTDEERQQAQQELTAAQNALNQAQQELTTARNALNQSQQELTTAQNELTTAQSELTDAQNALTQAKQELTTAQNALTQAVNDLENARKQPQWESKDLTLAVQIGTNDTTVDLTLAYDAWQHLAITTEYKNNGYEVVLYHNGSSIGNPVTLASDLLTSDRNLTIGQENVSGIEKIFKAKMSEFRLWDSLRDAVTINAEKDERKNSETLGLFHLALDQREAGATMTLVSSTLDLRVVHPPIAEINQTERILMFYGDQRLTLRNTLDNEQSFKLTLAPVNHNTLNYDLNLSLSKLYVAQTKGLSLNDYATGNDSTLTSTARINPVFLSLFFDFAKINPQHSFSSYLKEYIRQLQEAVQFEQQNGLLQNLPQFEASLIDVNNQPGWYILDTGDEQFLIKAELNHLKTTAERLQLAYQNKNQHLERQTVSLSFKTDPALEGKLSVLPTFKFKFERLSTFAIHELSLNLFTKGIDGLLSLDSQEAKEIDFNAKYQPNSNLVSPFNVNQIDFEGSYGLYYQEIFFHIPFLIANQLNANQNFAEAQKWYHYLFNPTIQSIGNDDLDRYWRYLPFRNLSVEKLSAILNNAQAITAYRNDPFDPHAIAGLRINAYQKTVVMKYIDNLLDWGDSLFSQDNRESINQAILLYVLAYNLLGERPQGRTSRKFEEIGDYQAIKERLQDNIPEFLTELTKSQQQQALASGNGNLTPTPNDAIVTTFSVPENADFIGYWDRVEDRLFKIRHSLNIEGVFRQLELFQPPLDVRALVNAVASGGRDLGSVLSDLSVPVPHYRYGYMLDRAKEMVSNVIDFGAALLGAIESRDGEQLAILENTHAHQILNLTTSIKEKERDAANKAIEELAISKQNIRNKKQFYDSLISKGLNTEEKAEIGLIISSQVVKGSAQVLKALEGVLGSVPDLEVGGSGFGGSPVAVTVVGGKQFSAPVKAALDIALVVADVLNTAASLTAKQGQYKRRANGWKLEQQTANFELQELDKQLEIAQLQLQIADQELTIHNKTLEQNQEIGNFYRNKFSNKALYNWMISRLSGLYFQAYKLAYDMAKSAEKALQYELPTNDSYISFGHWDSLKKGLLAGEALMLELNRMEKSHLDQDSRFLEIEKTISMQQVFPGALFLLQQNGECEFQLSEELFDRDYAGHYFRVIKTISLSMQIAGNTTQSINATLIQLGNKALVNPDISAVRYLLGIGDSQPSADTLRVNWRAYQQIALSKVGEDNGMFGQFDLNFVFDDRYFPFEGTGAVSSWKLEMPKSSNPRIDFSRITDITIHLKYTAKYDQGAFKQQVQQALQEL